MVTEGSEADWELVEVPKQELERLRAVDHMERDQRERIAERQERAKLAQSQPWTKRQIEKKEHLLRVSKRHFVEHGHATDGVEVGVSRDHLSGEVIRGFRGLTPGARVIAYIDYGDWLLVPRARSTRRTRRAEAKSERHKPKRQGHPKKVSHLARRQFGDPDIERRERIDRQVAKVRKYGENASKADGPLAGLILALSDEVADLLCDDFELDREEFQTKLIAWMVGLFSEKITLPDIPGFLAWAQAQQERQAGLGG